MRFSIVKFGFQVPEIFFGPDRWCGPMGTFFQCVPKYDKIRRFPQIWAQMKQFGLLSLYCAQVESRCDFWLQHYYYLSKFGLTRCEHRSLSRRTSIKFPATFSKSFFTHFQIQLSHRYIKELQCVVTIQVRVLNTCLHFCPPRKNSMLK